MFDQCNISLLSLQALLEAGYVQMTVVQEATLPIILEGTDVLAKAKTGTGKTLAFLLPAIEVVVKTPPLSQNQRRSPIIVLVVCPTRELASQTAAETNTLLRYHSNIGVQVVVGGTRLHVERKRLETYPCQILVATPGRLLYHIDNTPGFSSQLMGLKVLILDEADHLLDLGFRKDIEKIIDAIPRQRQSLLFSATIPQQVHQILQIALKRDHAFINTVGLGCQETHAKVLQRCIVASHENHLHVLYGVLKEHISEVSDYKVLVFCTTAAVTRVVYEMLLALNMNVREMHSRKTQVYRTRIYDEFRNSKCLILVTSDVSSRGVDYPDVTLVVQMGLPPDREQYIHRLGRTGRKGKEGHGLLLLAPWEEFFLADVQDLPIKRASLPEMHSEMISRVQHAIANVDLSAKEYAYHAWLGYYNSVKAIGRDKTRLVELANQFSRSIGLEQQPELLRKTAAKMGLKGIPGLRIKKKIIYIPDNTWWLFHGILFL